MLSILFLIVFIACIVFGKMSDWDEGWIMGIILSGIVAFFGLMFLFIWPSNVRDNIKDYNIQKEIYYNLDYSKMTELKKAKMLSKLIELDSTIRGHITYNKKFMWDLYIKDEDIEAVKLVKGWKKGEPCNK